MRKIVTSVLITSILITQLFTTASAYTATFTRVTQAKSNWCWAACAEIMGKKINPNSSLTQWDVVKLKKGTWWSDYPNVIGNSWDVKSGAEYVSANYSSYTVYYPWSSFKMYSEIKYDKKPFAILTGKYDSSGNRTYGHFILIYGIDTPYGTRLSYFDPFTGICRTTSHNDLEFGTDPSLDYRKYEYTVAH